MNNEIMENASFNSRMIALEEAFNAGDTKKVRFLIDVIKDKKEYYDLFTVESIEAELDSYTKALNNKDINKEHREEIKENIVKLRGELIEKKEFEKNKELVNEICNEQFTDKLPEKNRRTRRNRTLVKVGAVAGTVILLALAAKGCNDLSEKRNSRTSTTTTTTTSVETGDETISSYDDYVFEETNPIEIINNEINIDPVIGTGTNNGRTNNGNGSTGNGNGGTSTTTGTGTQTNGTTTTTTPWTPNVPGGYTENVIVNYGPDGRPESITWPTAETTINATLPNTTPTGTDRLPVEPSVIVDPVPTGDRPTETTQVIPVPTVVPAIPTGDIPNQSEVTYPTEPSVTVPTDATSYDPTFPTSETEPTSATLPDIPTWDIEGQDEIEYDINGNVVGKTMGLRR